MRLVPIHRQNSIPTDEDAPPLDFTLYTHPYHNFPTIVSHAHPRFIICNAGAKLASNLDVHVWSKQGDWLEEMTMINEIWNAWSKVVDQDQPDRRAFVQTKPSNHNISDSDSQHTTRHRMLRKRLKRKGLEEQSSPPRRNSKRQKGVNNSAWLDDEILRELNQQASSHAEGMVRKRRSVLDWLGGISNTEVGAEENTLGHDDTSDMTMANGTLAEHS